MARGGPEIKKKVLPPPPRRPIPPVQAQPSPPRYSRGAGRGIRRTVMGQGLGPGIGAQAQSALQRALARLHTQVDWRPTLVPLNSAIPQPNNIQQLGQEVLAGTYTWGVSPHLARVPTRHATTRTTSAPPSRVSRWPSEHTLAKATRIRSRPHSVPALLPTQWTRWPPAVPPRSVDLNPGTANQLPASPSPGQRWLQQHSSSPRSSSTERPSLATWPILRPHGPHIIIPPEQRRSAEDIRVGQGIPGPHPSLPPLRGASLPRQF